LGQRKKESPHPHNTKKTPPSFKKAPGETKQKTIPTKERVFPTRLQQREIQKGVHPPPTKVQKVPSQGARLATKHPAHSPKKKGGVSPQNENVF